MRLIFVLAGLSVFFLLPAIGSAQSNNDTDLASQSLGNDQAISHQRLTKNASNDPVPDIKINGWDGPLYLTTSDNVEVTISLDPGDLNGNPADWWVLVLTGSYDYWWAKYRKGLKPKWAKSSIPIRFSGATLRTVNSFTVLGPRTLPPGYYIFGFAVDDNKDGIYDATFIDSVIVDVSPAGPPPLWDNGDTNGTNGYSMHTDWNYGYWRTLLDDFVVPAGEDWEIDEFRCYYSPHGNVSDGLGFELYIRLDDNGVPGQGILHVNATSYEERFTGRVWIDKDERECTLGFDPFFLPEGHYWIEGTVVNPSNGYWWIVDTVTGNECWVNYSDLGGLKPGSQQFGVEADLSFRLYGSIYK